MTVGQIGMLSISSSAIKLKSKMTRLIYLRVEAAFDQCQPSAPGAVDVSYRVQVRKTAGGPWEDHNDALVALMGLISRTFVLERR